MRSYSVKELLKKMKELKSEKALSDFKFGTDFKTPQAPARKNKLPDKNSECSDERKKLPNIILTMTNQVTRRYMFPGEFRERENGPKSKPAKRKTKKNHTNKRTLYV